MPQNPGALRKFPIYGDRQTSLHTRRRNLCYESGYASSHTIIDAAMDSHIPSTPLQNACTSDTSTCLFEASLLHPQAQAGAKSYGSIHDGVLLSVLSIVPPSDACAISHILAECIRNDKPKLFCDTDVEFDSFIEPTHTNITISQLPKSLLHHK